MKYAMGSVLQRGAVVTLAVVLWGITATLASAEEHSTDTDVSVQTSVNVQATTATSVPPFRKPGKMLTDDAKERLQELRENAPKLPVMKNLHMRTATSSGERKNIIEDFREKKEEYKNERKERFSNLKERVQMLARTHLGATITRISAAIRHFDNIIERMESRIEKLGAAGVDTTSVEASLKIAVDLTTVAKADLEALKSLINAVTDSSDPDTVKAEIRAAIEKATNSVKAAHEALKEAAQDLSALVRASAEINSDDENGED